MFILAGIFAGLIVMFEVGTARFATNADDRRDRKKVADVLQLQLALEQYADENHHQYPPFSSMCSPIDNGLFKSYLIPKYIPSDNALVFQSDGKFEIAVGSNKKTYVIKTILENKNSVSLRDTLDVDGDILGCDCNDPAFCVIPQTSK